MPNLLKDGLPTTVNIGDTHYICEKKVTPPGVEQQDPIDISCMRSGYNFRTWPRQRSKWTPLMVTASYSTQIYLDQNVVGGFDGILTVGFNQVFVITFPDGATLSFWGNITKMNFQEMEEGSQPLVNFQIDPTLIDNNGNVQDPVYTVGALS